MAGWFPTAGAETCAVLTWVAMALCAVLAMAVAGLWIMWRRQLRALRTQQEQWRRAEETARSEVVQAQKLEALGRLAGGVAHDVNNVLAGIMGMASSIKMDIGRNAVPSVDDVDAILSACRRGRDMTLSLLGFARKGEVFKRPVALRREVEAVTKILARAVGKDLEIHIEGGEDVPQVDGDPSEIKNAIMNVCINAVDAMEGKGELWLSLGVAHWTAPRHGLEPGPYVVLAVRDTGPGMDEDTQRKVFEPFFTTKPEGQGTGLGMARVWGIVREHGGTVQIESARGRGTTVRMFFPALPVEQEDPGIRGSSPPVFAGRATVLLVDDEPLVRKSTQRVLEKIGYQVVAAEGGEEAVAVLTADPAAVDLVVLDMVMPHMDGTTVFHRLRQVRPDLPVVLCSGYTEQDAAASLLQLPAVAFVQKPFSVGDLSRQIAWLLRGEGPRPRLSVMP